MNGLLVVCLTVTVLQVNVTMCSVSRVNQTLNLSYCINWPIFHSMLISYAETHSQ